jgi:Reverse transcriptase (RNA-dependent DNA polymerase)
VGLALSMQSGLVSPVFHARYDDRFSTVAEPYGKYITKSQWQFKCGFTLGVPTEAWIEQASPSTKIFSSDSYNHKQDIDNGTTIHSREYDEEIQVPTNQEEIPINPSMSDSTPNENVKTTLSDLSPSKGETITRSGRVSKRPTYLDEFVTYDTNVANTRRLDTIVACTDYIDPISFMLTGNQDNFYYHEILREPDKDKFIEAMKEEIASHNNNGNWIPVLRKDLPPNTKVIPSVWAMRRKRRLKDGKIHKWKARLNVDGSKQIKGINFWETYAPVAQWISIRLILCMAAVNHWPVKTFDLSKLSHKHQVNLNYI